MQIGIDLGATKIEYVLLDQNNKEIKRERITRQKTMRIHFSIADIVKK